MAHLIVKNFGAIKSAEIEIKKYNFFIGHTSSGKSMMTLHGSQLKPLTG